MIALLFFFILKASAPITAQECDGSSTMCIKRVQTFCEYITNFSDTRFCNSSLQNPVNLEGETGAQIVGCRTLHEARKFMFDSFYSGNSIDFIPSFHKTMADVRIACTDYEVEKELTHVASELPHTGHNTDMTDITEVCPSDWPTNKAMCLVKCGEGQSSTYLYGKVHEHDHRNVCTNQENSRSSYSSMIPESSHECFWKGCRLTDFSYMVLLNSYFYKIHGNRVYGSEFHLDEDFTVFNDVLNSRQYRLF